MEELHDEAMVGKWRYIGISLNRGNEHHEYHQCIECSKHNLNLGDIKGLRTKVVELIYDHNKYTDRTSLIFVVIANPNMK